MDIMNDSEPTEVQKGLPHNPNDPKDINISETPTGMSSRDSEVCVFVFVLCNGDICLPKLFV